MLYIIVTWFVLTLVIASISYFAIWSRDPLGNKSRRNSVIGFFIGSILSFVLVWFSAGWSTPCTHLRFILPNINKLPLISAYPIPDEAIYLYLVTPLGPRGCYIPWDNNQANEMHKSEQEGKRSELDMGDFFAGEPNVQEIPVEPSPPKED